MAMVVPSIPLSDYEKLCDNIIHDHALDPDDHFLNGQALFLHTLKSKHVQDGLSRRHPVDGLVQIAVPVLKFSELFAKFFDFVHSRSNVYKVYQALYPSRLSGVC